MGNFIRTDKEKIILSKLKNFFPKVKLHFSGSTPPEIFIGRVNYPNVFAGILSPDYKGDTTLLSHSSEWVKKNLSIDEVLSKRSSMVYARQESNVNIQKSFSDILNQLALSSRPVSTEFFLKKQPSQQLISSKISSFMANPAPIQRVILEENPFVEKKIDYLTSDHDVKATVALAELYDSKISIEHLQKLLSVGLLGTKANRKMVPTKWGITAVDDILSKHLLRKIKSYQEISEILIFSDSYAGNYYQIVLLPGEFEFEVIEALVPSKIEKESIKGLNMGFWHDYEGFLGRKNYAASVTGAYYSNRLAVLEYLEKIKKQAKILVLRETTEEYYAALGTGILREITRRAMQGTPKKADSLKNAINVLDYNSKIPIEKFMEVSKIVADYGKQKKLFEF